MGGRGRIDVHHHIVPPRYKEWLESNRVTAGGLAIPSWSVNVAIDEMDAKEIATAVVSVSTPGVDVASGSQAGAKAREVNEYAAEVCRTHPDRFAFFATLTLPDVDGSLEEARYALDQLGALGVILPASVRGRYLGDVAFRPLFKELNRSGAVIFVHPSGLPAEPVAGQPPYVVDFLLDTTRSALSMAHGGVLDLRHLKIILAHAGGSCRMPPTGSPRSSVRSSDCCPPASNCRPELSRIHSVPSSCCAGTTSMSLCRGALRRCRACSPSLRPGTSCSEVTSRMRRPCWDER